MASWRRQFLLRMWPIQLDFLLYLRMNHHSLSRFRENNNVVVFPFALHIFMPLANFWLSCPDLYPLMCHPSRPLALGRGRILISGFFRSAPSLANYDVVHSLLLAGVDRDFPFTEDETKSPLESKHLVAIRVIYQIMWQL
jgi:hypothetical protein